MKVVLESKQYQISVARSGQERLEKARYEKPNLIILDIMMETDDKGFDVCRELKKDKNCRDIPILMLTAIRERTGMDFKKEASNEVWLPVDDYADKPLKPEELIAKVESLLKKSNFPWKILKKIISLSRDYAGL
jgi:DNA-binding response OmpR family regulator